MATHLSARIVWHEGAWNGRICEAPGQNVYCVVQQNIRETLADPRKLQREVDAAGEPLAELDGRQPPCSRDPIAFSPIGYTITHNDPLTFVVCQPPP